MNEAIKISNLSKSYGTHVVLNGLDFCVQQGEIFALLGVNGAGKTTSLECIEGLRKYDSGSITINGIMGIQLQSASLPEHIKPLEAVKLFAKWNKTSLDKETLEALGIYEFAKKQYYQLSTGQKRRLHLALALTRNPDILFLDEPTIGLDAVSKLAVREFILKLNQQNETTIILTTHDMQDIEALCQRVLLIGKGRLLYDGTLEELKRQYAYEKQITILYQGELTVPKHCNLIETKDLLPLMSAVLEIDTRLTSSAAVLKELTAVMDIKEFSIAEKSIDEIVAMLYRQFEIL